MAEPKQIRNVEQLKEPFRSAVKAWLAENPEIFAVETLRTAERQRYLVKKGMSWVSHSNHQDGVAIDIGFRGAELYPADMAKWRKVADSAKRHGIDWGFDLWQTDKPHWQISGSLTSPKLPPMTDAQTKLLQSILSMLSAAWGILPEKYQSILAEAADKLRKA